MRSISPSASPSLSASVIALKFFLRGAIEDVDIASSLSIMNSTFLPRLLGEDTGEVVVDLECKLELSSCHLFTLLPSLSIFV